MARKNYNLNYRGKFPVMSQEDLSQAISLRDEAKLQDKEGKKDYITAINRIAQGNLALVISIAKKYCQRYDVPFEDIVSEGAIGLINAAESYDPRHQSAAKFSSYAYAFIKNRIERIISLYLNNPTVISQEQRYALSSLTKNINELYATNLSSLEKAAKNAKISLDRANKLLLATDICRTYIDGFYTDDERYRGGRIFSIHSSPDEIAEKREFGKYVLEEINNFLKGTNNREKNILLLSVGFGGENFSLEKIGKLYGITRERVRQIKKEVCKKIKKRLEEKLKGPFY